MTQTQEFAADLYAAETAPAKAARKMMLYHEVSGYLPPKHPKADLAFFGGRVQIFRTGTFRGPLYRYDMRSAYPAALCVLGDTLSEIRLKEWEGGEGLSRFPFREIDGTVGYPPSGRSHIWSSEWRYTQLPYNPPFGYLRDVYALLTGADADYAAWLKQVMRCTWGSLLLPGFECYSLEWAGLVTQIVHDWVFRLVEPYSENLLCWNVDSVTLTEPIPMLFGPNMGQWREKVLEGLVIEPGTQGPRIGHPEPGTDRWNQYWPPLGFRDPDQESTPYRYQGPNKERPRYDEAF